MKYSWDQLHKTRIIKYYATGLTNKNNSQSIVDLSYLNEIPSGSNNCMKNILNTFLVQTPQLLDEMKVCLKAKNWNCLQGLAHKMKRSVDFFGLFALKEIIKNIEKHAANQTNLDALPGLIAKLDMECTLAMNELKMDVEELSTANLNEV